MSIDRDENVPTLLKEWVLDATEVHAFHVYKLEFFLKNLHTALAAVEKSTPSWEDFTWCLYQGFASDPTLFNEHLLRDFDRTEPINPGSRLGFERELLTQILELQAMSEERLHDPNSYFGVGDWYNVTTDLYLECGIAGLSATNSIEADWNSYTMFLQCGKSYE